MYKIRPIIFLGVGVLNTLLDFLLYTLLIHLIFTSSEDIWLVGIISGTFALFCAYTTHSLITWKDKATSKITIVKFFVFTGFGLWVVRPLLLVWLFGWEPLYRFIKELPIAENFDYSYIQSSGAFLVMIIVLTIYNYIVYSKFVFNNTRNDTDYKTH